MSDTIPVHDPKSAPSWKCLFSFTVRRHYLLLIAAIISSTLTALTSPALSLLLGHSFNHFTRYGATEGNGLETQKDAPYATPEEFISAMTRTCVLLTALGAISWGCAAAQFGTWTAFGNLQAKEARARLYETVVVKKGISWFEGRPEGVEGLGVRIQMDINELQRATSMPLGLVFHYVVDGISSFVLAMTISWKLTLVTVSPIVLSFILLKICSKNVKKWLAAQSTRLGKAARWTSATISNIDTVKTHTAEEDSTSRYVQLINSASNAFSRAIRWNSGQMSSVRFVALSMFVLGFWYGGELVRDGEISPGDVMTAFYSAYVASKMVLLVLPQMMTLDQGKMAGKHLQDMELDRNVRDADNVGMAVRPPTVQGRIKFKHVTFSYPLQPDQVVLQDASFEIAPGSTVFVVGPSGSGKSTISQLLMGIYSSRSYSGKITLDGRDLSHIDRSWLRGKAISLVEQRTVLFPGSVEENVRLGAIDGPDSLTTHQLESAIEFAGLSRILSKENHEPKEFEKVPTLSGGESQRVALARAHIRNAPILILDESTSALDPISRTLMMESIRKWRKGKTTIVITHELSLIKSDDQVLVIESGKIVEQGIWGQTSRRAMWDVGNDPTAPNAAKMILNRSSRAWRGRPTSSSRERKHTSRLSTVYSPNRESSRYTIDLSDKSISLFLNQFAESEKLSQTHPDNFQLATSSRIGGRPLSIISVGGEAQLATLDHYEGRGHSHSRHSTFAPTSQHRSQSSASSKEQPTKDSKVQPKSLTKIFATVWPNLTNAERLSFVGAIVAATIYAGCTPIFAYVFTLLMETYYRIDENSKSPAVFALIILAIAAADGLSTFAFQFGFQTCGQRWVRSLRIQAYSQVLGQPRSFFSESKYSTPQLTDTLDGHAESTQGIMSRFVGYVYIGVVMVITALTWSLICNWRLTLVALAALPVVYLVLFVYDRVVSFLDRKCGEASESVSSLLFEAVSNIRTVRVLSLERHFQKGYLSKVGQAGHQGLRKALIGSFFAGLSSASFVFFVALVNYYAAVVARPDRSRVGSAVQVINILVMTLSNLYLVVAMIPQISGSKYSASRLLDLAVELPKESHEDEGVIELSSVHALSRSAPREAEPPAISISHLTFAYPTNPTEKVLKDVSFSIPIGACTAIVGLSGSGKSTIASLVLRMFPALSVPASAIKLGSVPLRSIQTKSLRRGFAIVPQKPTLLPISISENICFGMPVSESAAEVTRRIEAAARAAGIHEFISSLPAGYDTIVGVSSQSSSSSSEEGDDGENEASIVSAETASSATEKGSIRISVDDVGIASLSGGQAQRIAIARALFRRPQLLILDEATSALDIESARAIQETIKSIQRDGISRKEGTVEKPTILIITHSRKMMSMADHVVVMEHGSVVQEGTYESLEKSAGAFKALLGAGELEGKAGEYRLADLRGKETGDGEAGGFDRGRRR